MINAVKAVVYALACRMFALQVFFAVSIPVDCCVIGFVMRNNFNYVDFSPVNCTVSDCSITHLVRHKPERIPETFCFLHLEAYVVKSVSLFKFASASDSAAYRCSVFFCCTGYDIVSVFKSAAFIVPPAACILTLLLRTI